MNATKQARTKSTAEQPKSALEALASEIAEVSEDSLTHINIDIPVAVTTAFGILPKLAKFADAIAALPGINQAKIDKFETYAMALYEAQADYQGASRPAESLTALLERATALRDRLYPDVRALVARGLLPADEVKDVRTQNGHRPLAMDLTLMANAVQGRWANIEGKTAIELAEVMDASKTATDLMYAIGERDQAPAAREGAASQRARVFALFLRSYDEVRRAVTFLRWEQGDADLIAPSLYQGRGQSRRKADSEEAPAQPTPPAMPPVPPPSSDQLPDGEPFTH